jgi:mRNA interferase RelE/StbE
MEVIITKGFIKDLARLPKSVIAAADGIIDKLKAAKSLQDSGVHFEKMEGQKKGENYYRIRSGEYRIGIENINPKIIVLLIVKRNDIYKVFPPK